MKKKLNVENSKNKEIDTKDIFEKQIGVLPKEVSENLLKKEKKFKEFVDILLKKSKGKTIGVYLNFEIGIKDGKPFTNFEKLKLTYLFDDFEKPLVEFNPRVFLGDNFDKYLIEEKKVVSGETEVIYRLKTDKNIVFEGTSISIMREEFYDGIYDYLKDLGQSIIYKDERNFISALKTIDIHRNMLLQKFEKYVVVYAGAGSWLRGEKSNDFDVFVVIDDTDVKKMPRLQVKEQLTKIIWQLSYEVAAITGVQVHIQVYLLTDFWDALKDAHPVMFTFLRDGVPFYDRGIYSAWKELLKLGKIRPSAEAIDMHMNVGTQLLDRAKKIFNEIVINDIYNSVLSPSQAVLMLKGFNPTTPKETVLMFREVLEKKEKIFTKSDVDFLEEVVKLFKKIEHNRDYLVKGAEVDKLIVKSEKYLEKIKKVFESVSEEKSKESLNSAYGELLNQIRYLPGFVDVDSKDIFNKFIKEYVDSGKLPAFIKSSLKSFLKIKKEYEKKPINVVELNKSLKEVRNIMTEIKNYRDKFYLEEISNNKYIISYISKGDKNSRSAEVYSINEEIYLNDLSNDVIYKFEKNSFKKLNKIEKEKLKEVKIEKAFIDDKIIKAIEEVLKTEKIFFN